MYGYGPLGHGRYEKHLDSVADTQVPTVCPCNVISSSPEETLLDDLFSSRRSCYLASLGMHACETDRTEANGEP